MNARVHPDEMEPARGSRRRAMDATASALCEAYGRADRTLADWLDTVARLIDVKRNLYWRGTITTADFQDGLDRELAEMREVAALLRTRPTLPRVGGI